MNKFLLKLAALALVSAPGFARGPSPYLPLNLDPEIERQIERVLILADRPVLTRPIAAARVLDALPAACRRDADLCALVRRYIDLYTRDVALTHASIEVASPSGADTTLPNRFGMTNDSEWQASARAHWQPFDLVLVSLGAVSYSGTTVLDGSMLSVGWSRAQLDIGYRPHWLSPMTDSSMLLSTEAQTLPSVTLSNYVPLTRFGLQYEVFAAHLSRSDQIAFGSTFTSGRPRLAGLHLGVEPATGWALSVNRLLQYGGGDRGGGSFSDLLNALLRPGRYDNRGPTLSQEEEQGNQQASLTSEFVFPGRIPFSVYFEYAGEDTSRGGSTSFGNASLAAGIHFPRLWRRFDFTYEVSEWQNAWYTSDIYRDGMTNKSNVLGHWGGDQRVFEDEVGAQSHMLRLGWEPQFGGLLQVRYRSLDNESYFSVDYQRAHEISLRYSRNWRQFVLGAGYETGSDVFGEDFSRLAAFVRYAFDASETIRPAGDFPEEAVEDDSAEVFVVAGVNANRVHLDPDSNTPRIWNDVGAAPHIGIGVRRAVSDRSDLGARIDFDDIDGATLISLRAIDYRYRMRGPLAITGFVGASRYDLPTPAYGLYVGIGGQYRDVFPDWDAGVDLRFVSNLQRDRLLPTDPPGARPDIFYDVPSVVVYLSRRF